METLAWSEMLCKWNPYFTYTRYCHGNILSDWRPYSQWWNLHDVTSKWFQLLLHVQPSYMPCRVTKKIWISGFTNRLDCWMEMRWSVLAVLPKSFSRITLPVASRVSVAFPSSPTATYFWKMKSHLTLIQISHDQYKCQPISSKKCNSKCQDRNSKCIVEVVRILCVYVNAQFNRALIKYVLCSKPYLPITRCVLLC